MKRKIDSLAGVLSVAWLVSSAAGATPEEDVTTPPPSTMATVSGPSLTELSGADLTVRHIHNLQDLADAVPGLSIAPTLNSTSIPQLFLRGEGQNSPGQITRDGAVGIYQDGFYIARAEAATFDLLELDHIDVLRGPQGAAYGRDTTGGVIAITSTQPSGTLRFKQYVDFGARNSFRVLSSLDAPSWHDISVKLTGLASGIDGYVKNLATSSLAYGLEHERAGRVQVSWSGLPTLRVDYFAELTRLDSTADYDTNPSLNGDFIYFFTPYYANPDGPMAKTYRPVSLPLSTSRHFAQGLTLTWRPSSTLTVESLTGYRTLDQTAWQDYAESEGFSEFGADLYEHHQLTEELSASALLLDGQLHLNAGAGYFRERGFHTALLDLPADGLVFRNAIVADARSESGHLSIEVAPAFARGLTVTLAARYTQDRRDAERFRSDSFAVFETGAASGAVNELSYHRIDPALTVSYRLTDAVSIFVDAASSYRAGGALETAPIGQFAAAVFRPESLGTVEVGLKSKLLDDRLELGVSAFDSRAKDVQAPLPINVITDELFTLQRVMIRGAELTLAWAPLPDLKLTASGAYLNWSVDRADVLAGTVLDPATGSGSPYGVGENVRQLFSFPFAPKYAGDVGADYTRSVSFGQLTAHLDYAYRGSVFADWTAGSGVPGSNFDAVPAYALLNARLALAQMTDFSHEIVIALWGHNILNRRYYALDTGFGGGLAAFSASGPPQGYTARIGAWAQPATYGVEITYRY